MSNEIITIKDVRKLLGKEASSRFTDQQVLEIITHLDFLFGIFFRNYEFQQVNKENQDDKVRFQKT